MDGLKNFAKRLFITTFFKITNKKRSSEKKDQSKIKYIQENIM